jgi:hypothetical protein
MINTVARAFAAALVFGVTFPAGALMFSGAVILSKPVPDKPVSATSFELPTVGPSGKPIRVITVETTPSPARQGGSASFAPASAPSSPAMAPAAPVWTAAPAAPASTAKGESCKRDFERLAKLRAEPTLEGVERFSRELTCDELRPQIARLLESVGGTDVAAVVAPRPVPPQAPAPVKAEASSQVPMPKGDACRRDSELLARLRANPTLDDAKRFSRDLACESLRAQASRLLESLGG